MDKSYKIQFTCFSRKWLFYMTLTGFFKNSLISEKTGKFSMNYNNLFVREVAKIMRQKL